MINGMKSSFTQRFIRAIESRDRAEGFGWCGGGWPKRSKLTRASGSVRRDLFSTPSVIRLTQYIDVRSRQNRVSNRHRIFARDRYRCQYCGRRGTAFDLTLDHILPKSRGGRTLAENLATACQVCNNRKGDRTPEEARMPLLTNPAALYYGLERAAWRDAARSRPEWRKYLFLEDAERHVDEVMIA